jgi:hypothetical protein
MASIFKGGGKTSRKGKADRAKRKLTPVARIALLALVCAAVLIVFYHGGKGNDTHRSRPGPPGPDLSAAQTDAPAAAPVFDQLVGRWRRPDGGYLLEIRGIDAAGRLNAGYFNPRPINVARADASRDGDTVRVLVELRDVGYPGATYSLVHDPRRNVLEGLYHQPALGQSFAVVFIPAP